MIDTRFFPGAKQYWHNGQLYDWNTFQVHVMAHVVHYGSSVFEGIRAYDTDQGPAIFRLPEHLRRFEHSAHTLNMHLPYTLEEITEAIKEVMKVNRLRSAYIRPNLFYAYGNLGLVPKASPVELTIGCWDWGAYLGEEGLERGVHVLLLPWRRMHHSQIDMRAKLGGMYVQSNIGATFARNHGFDEGVFLNLEGRIAEGPGENIIIVKNSELYTNDVTESILEGITRTTILELARDMGYVVHIQPITVEDFLGADEAFFTGTAAEVTPITRVTDGSDPATSSEDWKAYTIGNGTPGPLTRQLAQRYAETVRGKLPQYREKWLTFVYESAEEARKYLKDTDTEGVTKF